jgi:subtilisin-like proprotein convertase family protein
MEKSLLSLAKTFLVLCSFSTLTFAQDTWTPSELTGFGNTQNYRTKCMHVFKGNLYAGSGDNTGIVYKSATGNFGSWDSVLAPFMAIGIDKISSTNDGGGYLFAAAYSSENDNPKIYKSADGSNWSLYYKGFNRINNIVAFKGLGTDDSIYVMEQDNFAGTRINRSSYLSNDPSDTLASWDSAYQFPMYTAVISTCIYNGKLYMGTNNGGMLYSTADGRTYNQNPYISNGFGDPNTSEISALSSFGGYLYAGTYTYGTGAQIWRSNNDSIWTKLADFPGYSRITSFEVANSQLWASMSIATNGPGQIVKSADGLTFTISNNNGFGYGYNQGQYGNMVVFGNNLYYGSENYGYPAIAPGGQTNRSGFGFSTGGQIWRMCLGVSPTISAGPDQVKCYGFAATFNADAGFAEYLWDDGSTGQSLSTIVAGDHYVVATDVNGCSALDTVNLSTTPSPYVYQIKPVEGMTVAVCKGDSIHLQNFVNSNLTMVLPAVTKITNDSIFDYTTIYDTLNVTGVNDFAGNALLSVTIDSLFHTNDGDLTIRLIAPDGSSAYLAQYVGYASQNYIGTVFSTNATNYTYNDYGPFTGNYQPYNPFSNFTGNANGNWVLEVSDVSVGSDVGALKGWSLKFSVPDTVMNYSWSPSIGLSSDTILNPFAFPVINSAYTLTVTNSIGCSMQVTDTLLVPSINIQTVKDSVCSGASAILYAAGGVNPVWSPSATLSGSTGMNVIATPTVTTTYLVNDTLMGCAVSDSIKIYADPVFTITASSLPSLCLGDTTTLNGGATGGTPPYSYLWNNGTSSYNTPVQQIIPSGSTTYTLSVTDAFGCLQFTSSDVTVVPNTHIYGHAQSYLGDVTSASVVLYKFFPFLTHFDTVQTTSTDGSGNFSFYSIDRSDYLIKVFPNVLDTTLVPTYYGNSFVWSDTNAFSHSCGINDSLNINVIGDTAVAPGPGYLHGVIKQDLGFGRAPGDPVPGIDVKLGRNPGGSMYANTQSDSNGEYSFSSVPYGDYIVYVDIPGLERSSTYTFTVGTQQSVYNYLDYLVDSTSIHIDSTAGVGISDPTLKENNFIVYPNPSKGDATIEYTISGDSQVSLGIYNVLGVKVADIVNAHQSIGTYKVNINEKNKNLSAGIYFVTLIANGTTTIHKITITE